MDDDDRLAMISRLESRMDTVEGEIVRIRQDQEKLKEDIHSAALETNGMCGEIAWIKEKLIEMTAKKVRAIDILIICVALLFSGVSAYAAIQNNQMTKVMMQIEKGIGN